MLFSYPIIYGLVRGHRFVLFFSEFFRLVELSRRWLCLIFFYLRLFEIFLTEAFFESFVLVPFWDYRSSHDWPWTICTFWRNDLFCRNYSIFFFFLELGLFFIFSFRNLFFVFGMLYWLPNLSCRGAFFVSHIRNYCTCIGLLFFKTFFGNYRRGEWPFRLTRSNPIKILKWLWHFWCLRTVFYKITPFWLVRLRLPWHHIAWTGSDILILIFFIWDSVIIIPPFWPRRGRRKIAAGN
jgi:hypothetical protein